MLQAAYPDEVQQIEVQESPKFPLQCMVFLETTSEDRLQQQQVSQVTLEWNEGYPINSGIQVVSYRFASSSSSSSKARMDAVLSAIKQESELCQEDEVEGGLACVAAALRAWNDFQEEGNHHDENHHNNHALNGDEPSSTSRDSNLPTTSFSWISGPPLLDRKSTFQAHVCRVESEQQVRQALDQLLTSHSKLQRATHNMVRVCCRCSKAIVVHEMSTISLFARRHFSMHIA